MRRNIHKKEQKMKEMIDLIKKIIIENDFDGKTVNDNEEIIGVTPDVRLEYNAKYDWWTASLSWETPFDYSKVCCFWLNGDYEPAECRGKTAIESLTALDSFCQNQRNQGAVLYA